MNKTKQLTLAYEHCRNIAKSHYENFPVASLIVSRQHRPAFWAIYAFARQADDIADESNASVTQRKNMLDKLDATVRAIKAEDISPEEPALLALADTISKYELPLAPFLDLICAFKQDLELTRYQTWDDLNDYCARSANPIGKLLLYLHGIVDHESHMLSDKLCTALQLLNFLQDIEQDLVENNRLYIPLEELQQFSISESDLQARINNEKTRALILFQTNRIRKLLEQSANIKFLKPVRLGMESLLIHNAAIRLVNKLEQNVANIYRRPRFGFKDRSIVVFQTLATGTKTFLKL